MNDWCDRGAQTADGFANLEEPEELSWKPYRCVLKTVPRLDAAAEKQRASLDVQPFNTMKGMRMGGPIPHSHFQSAEDEKLTNLENLQYWIIEPP